MRASFMKLGCRSFSGGTVVVHVTWQLKLEFLGLEVYSQCRGPFKNCCGCLKLKVSLRVRSERFDASYSMYNRRFFFGTITFQPLCVCGLFYCEYIFPKNMSWLITLDIL